MFRNRLNLASGHKTCHTRRSEINVHKNVASNFFLTLFDCLQQYVFKHYTPCLFVDDLLRFQVTTAPFVAAEARMWSKHEENIDTIPGLLCEKMRNKFEVFRNICEAIFGIKYSQQFQICERKFENAKGILDLARAIKAVNSGMRPYHRPGSMQPPSWSNWGWFFQHASSSALWRNPLPYWTPWTLNKKKTW